MNTIHFCLFNIHEQKDSSNWCESKADRYSNRAVKMLNKYGHEVIALGFESATVEHIAIQNKMGIL